MLLKNKDSLAVGYAEETEEEVVGTDPTLAGFVAELSLMGELGSIALVGEEVEVGQAYVAESVVAADLLEPAETEHASNETKSLKNSK